MYRTIFESQHHYRLQAKPNLSPFTKDFRLCFVFFLLFDLDWYCPVTVYFKYNSALRKWQQREESIGSTDFSQIPRQWWGQSPQTSVFTSHWQTAASPLVQSFPVPFNKYYHVTATWLTSEGAKPNLNYIWHYEADRRNPSKRRCIQ